MVDATEFTGKERDAKTGLDYFGARYMSAAQGRFTSPDAPLIDQYSGDPQSWNLYTYTRNNPLVNVDPDGYSCVRKTVPGGTEVTDDGDGRGCSDLTGTATVNDRFIQVPYDRGDPAWDSARSIFGAVHSQTTDRSLYLHGYFEAIQWMDGVGEVKAAVAISGPLLVKLLQAARHLDRNKPIDKSWAGVTKAWVTRWPVPQSDRTCVSG